MLVAFQQRTDEKLRFAKIHLVECEQYINAMSNDEWECAHQESCFYHLAGTVDAILQEINEGYKLGLKLRKVNMDSIKTELTTANKVSPAFDLIDKLRGNNSSWLSQLYRWRNHGTHIFRVGKYITASVHIGTPVNTLKHTKIDNEFKDPATGQDQLVYKGKGCLEVLNCLYKDVSILLNNCRKFDGNL